MRGPQSVIVIVVVLNPQQQKTAYVTNTLGIHLLGLLRVAVVAVSKLGRVPKNVFVLLMGQMSPVMQIVDLAQRPAKLEVVAPKIGQGLVVAGAALAVVPNTEPVRTLVRGPLAVVVARIALLKVNIRHVLMGAGFLSSDTIIVWQNALDIGGGRSGMFAVLHTVRVVLLQDRQDQKEIRPVINCPVARPDWG